MTHDELTERCAELIAALQRLGARIARPVVRDDAQVIVPSERQASGSVARVLLREDVLDETLALFADGKSVETDEADGERVHSVPTGKRLTLEYHKNTILSFFVPGALIANALSVHEGDAIDEGTLRERVASLSKLFKYEFMYRADATFDEIFDDALRTMIGAGEVERVEGGLRATPGSLVPVYAQMLRTYFEAYRLAVIAAADLRREGEMKKKDWVKQTLARGDKLYLSGEIALKESISQSKLENALRALHDYGLIRVSRETVEAGAALADDEATKAFERRIAKYL